MGRARAVITLVLPMSFPISLQTKDEGGLPTDCLVGSPPSHEAVS
jgi:hypothetical protein